MILSGTFHNGAIVLNGEAPFAEGEKIQFEIVADQPPITDDTGLLPKIHTAEEILGIVRSSNVSIDTKGWKFNREEANER